MSSNHALNHHIIQVTPNDVIAAAEASDCQEANLAAALYQAITATIVEITSDHEPAEAVRLIREMFANLEQDQLPTLN